MEDMKLGNYSRALSFAFLPGDLLTQFQTSLEIMHMRDARQDNSRG